MTRHERRKAGALGTHSEGKIHSTDEGDLLIKLGVDQKNKVVVIEFGKSVAWFANPKSNALALAAKIKELAEQLPDEVITGAQQ